MASIEDWDEEKAEDRVSTKSLGMPFDLHSDKVRRHAARLGIVPRRALTTDSPVMPAYSVTREEADRITAWLSNAAAGHGLFYIIQLIPEFCPGRVKMGWSGDVAQRLATYHLAAPTAVIAGTWPCPRDTETDAMAYISCGSRQMLKEVFECSDLETLMSRADDYFFQSVLYGTVWGKSTPHMD